MKEYTVPATNTYTSHGSSEGSQVKFFYAGKWFKQNLNGYEGKAEHLASCVLACSNIDDFVWYDECIINGRKGCVSDSFLRENERFMSLDRLHKTYTGERISNQVMQYNQPKDRLKYVEDFVFKYTNLNISTYLSDTFALDAFILNCDRHFNNLGVVYNGQDRTFRPAPIFDNGAGFLSSFAKFPPYNSIEENAQQVVGFPICSNLDLQAHTAEIQLCIDYEMLESQFLQYEEPSRALDVLRYQMEYKRNLFPDFCKKQRDYEEER